MPEGPGLGFKGMLGRQGNLNSSTGRSLRSTSFCRSVGATGCCMGVRYWGQHHGQVADFPGRGVKFEGTALEASLSGYLTSPSPCRSFADPCRSKRHLEELEGAVHVSAQDDLGSGMFPTGLRDQAGIAQRGPQKSTSLFGRLCREATARRSPRNASATSGAVGEQFGLQRPECPIRVV